MTDAESILLALEPEDEIADAWLNPCETFLVDTWLINWAACGATLKGHWTDSLTSPTRTVVESPKQPRFTFDDIWGAAFDQAPTLDQTIQRQVDELAMDPHDELLLHLHSDDGCPHVFD